MNLPLPPLTNAKWVSIEMLSCPAGISDPYTTPLNRKFLLMPEGNQYNAGDTFCRWQSLFKSINGTYYPIRPDKGSPVNLGTINSPVEKPLLLNSGEGYSVSMTIEYNLLQRAVRAIKNIFSIETESVGSNLSAIGISYYSSLCAF